MKNLSLDKDGLDRKKKRRLSGMILSFEDFMEVEDTITSEIFTYNKLLNKKEELLKSITLTDVKEVLKTIDINNKCTLLIK